MGVFKSRTGIGITVFNSAMCRAPLPTLLELRPAQHQYACWHSLARYMTYIWRSKRRSHGEIGSVAGVSINEIHKRVGVARRRVGGSAPDLTTLRRAIRG